MNNVFHSWEQDFKTWFHKAFPLSHPEKGAMALGWQAAKAHTLTSKLAAMAKVNIFVHIFIIDGHQVLVRKTTLENNDGIEKPAIAYEMQFEHITMIGNLFFENDDARDMAFRGFAESDAKNIAERCMRTAGLLK